jgi:uncharacterized protein HemX
MSNVRIARTARFLLAAAMTLALAGGGVAPAFAQGQGQGQAKSAANTQRDKKPAQSCEGMDKKTKAYSDCVKKQAQTTKTDKQADKKPETPPGTAAAKAADKAKGKKVN